MSIIEVRGLSKSFEDRWVLSNVNFQVEEGDIFGYLGPNGAGKTTTMRIMLGLLKPTQGEALIRGRDMGTDNEMRRHVGVLLEKNGVYDRLTRQAHMFERTPGGGRVPSLSTLESLNRASCGRTFSHSGLLAHDKGTQVE